MSEDARSPRAWAPRVAHVGEWQIHELSDGTFRLDGGAMWGVVPKTMWEAKTPAAADNTIGMALRPFLCRRGSDVVLIEVGVGDRWSDKLRRIYHIDRTMTLELSLAACRVRPEDVTHVIASHCHWDHIGAQVIERDGALLPQFPNAVHYAPRSEVEWAKQPDHARAGSYRSEDVLAVEERGLLQTYSGTEELLAGVRAHVLGGHSDGVSVITLGDEDTSSAAIFWSDVVPTTHHIQPPYIMAYDIDVARSFDQRSRWIKRAAERGWLGLFYHDEDHAFGRIVADGKRYAFVPTNEAAEVM